MGEEKLICRYCGNELVVVDVDHRVKLMNGKVKSVIISTYHVKDAKSGKVEHRECKTASGTETLHSPLRSTASPRLR